MFNDLTTMMKKNITIIAFVAVASMMPSANAFAIDAFTGATLPVEQNDNTKYVSNRPAPAERLFVSKAIDKKVKEVKKLLKDNPYLA